MGSLRTIRILFCLLLPWGPLAAGAQSAGSPPASLHRFFCHPPKSTPTAWERWLRWKKPKKLFLPQPHYDFDAMTHTTSPATPEDDPFGKNLKVYNQQMYVFGLSGAKGFNLRNWPRTFPQIIEFIRRSKLTNLRRLLPQPESNPLRMQNMIGASFYFNF